MKKISNGAGIILVAAAMILSAVAVTAETDDQTPSVNCNVGIGTIPGAIGPVVWDNSLDFTGLGAAQKDVSYPFEAECADDFHFDEATEVTDVHWIGGYWQTGYESAHWPWEITFYNDRGDGNAPGDVYLGPFEFDNTQYTEELIQDTGTSIYYTFSVDLDESIVFEACQKFWISIRGVGIFPPQSGWGYHDTTLLHMAVFRSALLGYDNWTDSVEVWQSAKDMAFQLTGPLGPVPPTPPDIDGPSEGKPDTELCWTFHSSDENGDMVKYYVDWGDGTNDETALNEPCTPVELCHTYGEAGTYTISAYAEDESGETSGTTTIDVVIPRSRSVNHPLILRFLERFPNVFSILRQLLG